MSGIQKLFSQKGKPMVTQGGYIYTLERATTTFCNILSMRAFIVTTRLMNNTKLKCMMLVGFFFFYKDFN